MCTKITETDYLARGQITMKRNSVSTKRVRAHPIQSYGFCSTVHSNFGLECVKAIPISVESEVGRGGDEREASTEFLAGE